MGPELQNCLFPIQEVEQMILNLLDLKNLAKLMEINQYFYEIVHNDPIYSELKEVYEKYWSWKKWRVHKISMGPQKMFLESCRYGHLHAAKYLYSKYSNSIDIHAINEYAFRWACGNGHLEIAKYLYLMTMETKKINIFALNNFAFEVTCENGHVDVAKWLCRLDPEVHHYANKIPYSLRSTRHQMEII